jgi:protein TonB
MKKLLLLSFILLSVSAFSQTTEPVSVEPVAKVEEPIYEPKEVDKLPDYPGGIMKFYNFVGANFKKTNDDAHGKILMTFVVESDGSISTIRIVRDVEGMGTEAIRVMKKCPKWIPGELNGKNVRTKFQLPINL